MTHDTKELVRRYYQDALGEGDLASLDELATPDYNDHGAFPGQGPGLEGLKRRVSMLHDCLAPRFAIEDVISDGDRLVVRWTNSGTHVAEFMGIPPTNKSFSIAGIDIYRVAGGKLAEHWDVVDQLSMLQQLGLIPTPEGADA
ncbi:MAG: hypothetical protein QOF16_507 [Actinomycetota bacterium]|nr:hypothetical protein [Actinomycetota bacterium]